MTAQLALPLSGSTQPVDAPTSRQHRAVLIALYHDRSRGLCGEEAATNAGIRLATTATTRAEEMSNGKDPRFPTPLVWQSEFKHRKTTSGRLATTFHLTDAGLVIAHDLATREG